MNAITNEIPLMSVCSPQGETGFAVRASDYDLAKTFECGQCFRFSPVADTEYDAEVAGVAMGKYMHFAKSGDMVLIFGADEAEIRRCWLHYLALDTDYGTIRAEVLSTFADYPVMRRAVDVAGGIRILRQERFETLCSFILSQNNNIPRIKKMIETLCTRYGEPIDTPLGTRYAFPSASALSVADEEELKGAGLGYRARYIAETARRVSSGEFDLDGICVPNAAEELTKLLGVGGKVCACVRLFGFGDLSAFPIDVWIRRAADKYFGKDFDLTKTGKYGGVAQQYLFYYERYAANEHK